MDTLIILCDTITTNVIKVVGSCKPYVQEAETNWEDVVIAGIICLTVVIVVGIVASRYNLFMKQEADTKEKEKDKELERYKDKSNFDLGKAEREADLKGKEKDKEFEHYKNKSNFDLEKAKQEADIKEKEKDKELERYKDKSTFDITQEKDRNSYLEAGDFFKQICDAIKDKEGKFDNATLDILLKFFKEKWGCPGNPNQSSSNGKTDSKHENEES